MRHGEPCGGTPQPEMDPGRAVGHRAAGICLYCARDPRIQRLRRPRCRTQPQRVSLLVLYLGRMPRGTRKCRASVARHDDGAVLCEGLPAGHPSPLPVLQPLLARAGHRLGRYLQPRLPGGRAAPGAAAMTEHSDYEAGSYVGGDRVPGRPEARTLAQEVRGYLLGLGLATLLTIASVWADQTREIYASGIAMALLVLAVAQIGIHLIFFLHITTDPDNENNVLALAFGVLIVCLIVFGSLWVMLHLNHNLMPMDTLIRMQR